MPTGRTKPGSAIEAATALTKRARREGDRAAPVIIGRDRDEGDGEILESVGNLLGPEAIEQPFAVEQHRIATREEIAETAHARLENGAEDLGAVAEGHKRMRAQAGRRYACRVSRPDDRADRGAGDGDRPKAHFIERFEHGDMGEAARSAAAERKRDGRLSRCGSVAAPGRHSAPERKRVRAATVSSGASSARKWPQGKLALLACGAKHSRHETSAAASPPGK